MRASSREITCLPRVWPHFFGLTWSSIITAAAPARAYSMTVRWTLSALP